jgi:LacI family transcriptional regulator
MMTIRDVAKKAKVSVMTVSRMMNDPEKVSTKTIQRIRHTMEHLGYHPNYIARSLVRKKTNTLGIIMPDIKNTFFNSWFRWVEDYARSFNYNLLLCNTDENPEYEMNHIHLLLSQRVDGIIIVPRTQSCVSYLKKSRIPFVLVDRVFSDMKADYITTDHYAGAFEATEYLIKLGHRRIGILKGPGILYPDVERFRGFSDSMKKHKLKIDLSSIRNCDFQEDKSYNAVIEMLKSENPPSELFSFNSLMTIGAINAMNALKLSIPKNLSVVSFDEIPGQLIFRPKVTYVLQPIEELGRNATKIILEKIEHPSRNKTHRICLKPKLVVGESCRMVK